MKNPKAKRSLNPFKCNDVVRIFAATDFLAPDKTWNARAVEATGIVKHVFGELLLVIINHVEHTIYTVNLETGAIEEESHGGATQAASLSINSLTVHYKQCRKLSKMPSSPTL